MGNIHQPMDKFFKYGMRDIRVAREFFEHHLPAEIKQHIDLTHLKLEKETFIEKDLKISAADVVCSTRFDNKPGYLYLLIEQQTKPDKWMPLRVMQYMIKLVAQARLQHHQSDSLPLVYPMIFYNGQRVYPFGTDFYELFGEHSALAKWIWSNPINLVDLQKVTDEELRRRPWAGILAFVLKHQREKDFLAFAEEVLKWLRVIEVPDSYDYTKAILHYIVNRAPGKDVEGFLALSQEYLSPTLRTETMTIAQQLIAQGMQQGIQQGMQQGIQQGMQQGIQQGVQQGIQRGVRQIIEHLLTVENDLQVISKLTGLSVEEISAFRQAKNSDSLEQ